MQDTSSEGASSRPKAGTPLTAQMVDGGGLVTLLRVATIVILAQTVLQALLAGLFLNGDTDSIDAHSVNSKIFSVMVVLQVVVAVLLWKRNRWLKWPVPLTAVVLVVTLVQFAVGENSEMAVHTTLGVALCGLQSTLVNRSLLLRADSSAAPAAG